MIVVVTAKICFIGFNKKVVTLDVGTKTFVDLKRNVAYHKGHHFDISPGQYALPN